MKEKLLLLLPLAFASLIPLLIQFLWNQCLVPSVDGIHAIGYLQAAGLWMLSTVLFKDLKSESKQPTAVGCFEEYISK